MKKKAKQNKHVKVETKQTKNLGFLGNGITHARIGLLTHNQACVQWRSQKGAKGGTCPP